MTDLPTDTRLRAILSSWHKSRRYRPEAPALRPVRATSQTDLDREFKRPNYIGWQWFFIPLPALTIIHYFYLRHWG
jgi:hypothetical protein